MLRQGMTSLSLGGNGDKPQLRRLSKLLQGFPNTVCLFHQPFPP